jgi:hypothetical protein
MTFALHIQGAWEDHAGNPRLPLWLRASALAYGKHHANGHARFKVGEVALVLSRVDMTTGEMTVPSKQAVHRAISRAIEYRFLSAGSSSRCLVVPSGMVEQGPGGRGEPCSWHEGRRSRGRARAPERPLCLPDPLSA